MGYREVTSTGIQITSNLQWRDKVYAWELTNDDLKTLGLTPKGALDSEEYGDEYVRAYGDVIYLGDAERAPDDVKAMGWDGIMSLSYFSAYVFRYFDKDGYEDFDRVIVGYATW